MATRMLTLALAAALTSAAPAIAEDVPVNFGQFAQSAANLSAIAAGVALVSPCSVPLTFAETRSGSTISLMISCTGSGEDEATVVVKFNDFGGVPTPAGFDLAG